MFVLFFFGNRLFEGNRALSFAPANNRKHSVVRSLELLPSVRLYLGLGHKITVCTVKTPEAAPLPGPEDGRY